jgi:hypothetical protein
VDFRIWKVYSLFYELRLTHELPASPSSPRCAEALIRVQLHRDRCGRKIVALTTAQKTAVLMGPGPQPLH